MPSTKRTFNFTQQSLKHTTIYDESCNDLYSRYRDDNITLSDVKKNTFKSRRDFYELSSNVNVDLEVYTNYKKHIWWSIVSAQKRINSNENMKFINDHACRLDFAIILEHTMLDFDFIKTHIPYFKFKQISRISNLNQEFMEEFADFLDWDLLSTHQANNMSDEFVIRHADKLNLQKVLSLVKFKKLATTTFKYDMLKIYYKIFADIDGKQYIYAWKSVRDDYTSFYDSANFDYSIVGKTYKILGGRWGYCDFDPLKKCARGLNASTRDRAITYAKRRTRGLNTFIRDRTKRRKIDNKYKLIKVKIYVDDLVLVYGGYGTIRCSKFIRIE